MKKLVPLLLIITIGISLIGCNSVKHNTSSSKTHDVTSRPSTQVKTTSPSQMVDSVIKNPTSINEASPTEETSTIPDESAKADNFYIEEIVSSYERLLVHAINDNDFSLIKNLLMPESDIYKSQENFVTEQYKKGIKYKLIEVYPEEIKQSSKKDEYKVYVTVNIEISEFGKEKETKEFKRIYTVIDDGKIRKITDIEEWVED